MTSTNIQVIEQQGVRVLTTAQLAECYGTDSKTIAHNYQRNKERYEEGKHYVCLKGEDLRAFKSEMTNCHFAKNLNVLYLWTERGALLHAKSLNTDKAWEVYGELVETYFRAQKAQIALQNLSPQTQAMINLEIRQNALKAKVADIEQRLDSMTAEPEPEPPKALPKKWSERETDYLRKAYALGQRNLSLVHLPILCKITVKTVAGTTCQAYHCHYGYCAACQTTKNVSKVHKVSSFIGFLFHQHKNR